MNQIKNVCVYSASSTKIAPVYFAVAEELGQLLALHGINLINGATNVTEIVKVVQAKTETSAEESEF